MIKKIKKVVEKKIAQKEYAQVLKEIIKQIEQSQTEAISSINEVLNKRNLLLGKIIVEKQKKHGWGSNFLENIAKDMQNMAPGIEGFSSANIYRMKAFYEAYGNSRTAVRELEELPIFTIPWGHNVVLLQKLKNNDQRLWYAQKSIEYGWSRSMLETWIKSDLYNREGKAITNFSKTLPKPHSDMAQQSLKDPYNFDFLTLQKEHLEQELEQGLVENVQKLLLEMGKGFALVGRQYHLEKEGDDLYIDLLFYHTKLKCYIVVELKARAFDPRDVGQLNYYLSAVDDMVRDSDDKPTIGLLLCKTKKNYKAEYALRNFTSPIGIAEYETAILKKLSKELKSNLPTIKEIETELERQDVLADTMASPKKTSSLAKVSKTKLNKRSIK